MSNSLSKSSYQVLQDYCIAWLEKTNGSCPVPSFDDAVLGFAYCEFGLEAFAVSSFESCSKCSLSGSGYCHQWEQVEELSPRLHDDKITDTKEGVNDALPF